MAGSDFIMAEFAKRLEAESHALLSRRERERHDKRLNGLADYIAIFENYRFRDGQAGFGDVVGHLMSARHWRNLRAKSLYQARRQQLNNDPRSARFWLRKAAEQRISEKHYRAAERRAEIMPLIMEAAGFSVAAE